MEIDYTPPDRKLLDLTLGEMGISNGTVLNDVGLQTHRIDEARNAVDYGVPFPGGPSCDVFQATLVSGGRPSGCRNIA